MEHSTTNSEAGRLHDNNVTQQQQQQRPVQNILQQIGGEGGDDLPTSAPLNAAINLAHFLPKRKKPLQRQMSTEHSDGDGGMEQGAAAIPPRDTVLKHTSSVSKIAAHKRMQFQQQRPHSKLAIQLSQLSPAEPLAIASPATTQSLPVHILSSHATRSSSTSSATSLENHFKQRESFESSASQPSDSAHNRCPQFPTLQRDNSIQSDSSRYSSVDSLLEARKPDPEAILINLGFGPTSEDILSRIPARFLKPSQVRGIDTDAFVKRLQLASLLADHSVLGYRGLTGNPDVPPSFIVAKIMQRFEVNERKKSMDSIEHAI